MYMHVYTYIYIYQPCWEVQVQLTSVGRRGEVSAVGGSMPLVQCLARLSLEDGTILAVLRMSNGPRPYKPYLSRKVIWKRT